MIIDSHCHLTYEPMSLSLDETIKRANLAGVKYMLTISTEDKSFTKILKILEHFKTSDNIDKHSSNLPNLLSRNILIE